MNIKAHITPMGAPTPGSTRPGDLYVDLQSKTIWLGVDSTVDPSESVLLIDQAALAADIVAAEMRANSYTDAQILTRAPISHTHPSSQITDFTAAVQAVVGAMPQIAYVRGMIIAYHGPLTNIGVGALAGWALCNGSNGTPDLRDRFILGAGNKAPGTTPAAPSFATSVAGAHGHSVSGTAITIAQMPIHDHGGNTGGQSGSHTHNISGNTGSESNDHTHPIALKDGDGGIANTVGTAGSNSSGGTGSTGGRSASHTHPISLVSGVQNQNHTHVINDQGGGATHSHTLGVAGDHTHVVTGAQIRDSIPYTALAYIMKL